MAKRISKSMQSLLELYRISGLDPVIVSDRAKVLLSIYRQMSWICTYSAKDQVCELKELATGELDAALVYLINFAPKEKRQIIQDNLLQLFRNRTMLLMCEQALEEVESFPERGEEYKDILIKKYMGKRKYSELEMLGELMVDRSVYYQRKKEAIYAFGLALWGKIIPGIIN